MKWTRVAVVVVAAGLVSSPVVWADVRLPRIFGDHMVLQREQPIPVWGWADSGEQVSVKLGDAVIEKTTADDSGKWMVKLPPRKASGPVTLTISGKNRRIISDILIGEVWICSGQSNMEFQVSRCNNAEQEVAAAKYPLIRHIKVPKRPASFPEDDMEADWTVCSPETAGSYTAVGYFFGRYLHEQLNVPIGLVNASWGGTRIEPWTPPCGFAEVPELADILHQVELTFPAHPEYKKTLSAYLKTLTAWTDKAAKSLEQQQPLDPPPAYPRQIQPLTGVQTPTTLYNGLIHPIVPFAIRGAIWYQGESNHVEGMLYREKTKALVGGWRQVWNQGAFPFYFVQLAPFQYGNESPYILPVFWEAQTKCLEIPNTGMAVIHDIGNLKDIHPKNKQDVGKRLALIALAKTYGHEDLEYSGPMFQSLAIDGNKLRVTFDHVGSGLISRDGKPLNWFEIIGQDTDFVKANAVIDGNSVVLSSPKVKQACAVRFAWHKLAEPNLANKEGLPALPFRAGNVPKRDWLALKVDEAKDYKLVYDLDLAKLGTTVKYDVDNSRNITGDIDRIAYFLELRKDGEKTDYVYVSMDPFTKDLKKIGIPTVASGAHFQQKASNLNVVSNVTGIATGTGLPGGNIEFWPNNYGPDNAAKVPNASSSLYDFGDLMAPPVDGHGCMQVHNYEAKQTLFAINQWKAGQHAEFGIGNSDGRTRDWTFKGNGADYLVKRLRVLVRVK